MLQYGGNTKLAKFFDENAVPKDTPILFKYNTKAAKQYREKLLSLVSVANNEHLDDEKLLHPTDS